MPITPIDNDLIFIFIMAGTVIERDGKYLLVREKQKKYYRKWNLPAGKVGVGEIIIPAAIREAKEETGYDVEIIREIGVYHRDGDESVMHAFLAKIIGGELKPPEDEILTARWFTLEEVEDLAADGRIRAHWVVDAIRRVTNPQQV